MSRLKRKAKEPVEKDVHRNGRGKLVISPDRYVNRELSWLNFNSRVLEEAENPDNPLLERLKFLSIFESNLDEFFMVRVSGLIEQQESAIYEITPDGLTPSQQLQMIADVAKPLRARAGAMFADKLRPALAAAGITLQDFSALSPRQQEQLNAYFRREVFPLCTPLILYPAHTFPFISNRSLNLAVELFDEESGSRLARVKVPNIPRFVRVNQRKNDLVPLEQIIRTNLDLLFPGVQVRGSYLFRVVRDADIEIRELEAADLVSMIEQSLRLRRFGDPVLLEVESSMPAAVKERLMQLLLLDPQDVFEIDGLVGLESVMELTKLDLPEHKFKPHQPYLSEKLGTADSIFTQIQKNDILIHHPYDSFRTVVEFIRSAADDPSVVGIKQTLYRIGEESPIVQALLDAAENGKQVAVMVELKARFDESNNLVWARALERAGVHVTYGFTELKTHAKLCLIVRRELNGLHTYAHIGTGNYNPLTARFYTDFGFFTDDPDITQDISELFNFLTGFSKQDHYRKLLVAPINLREGIVERIYREIKHFEKTGSGRILFKLNALVDPEVIDALYEASEAGIPIDLIVRGICCLRPGVPGMSSRIRVISIVGRFLEHSRVYYFQNGGKPEALIGSADLMRRNLDRRVEALAPITSPTLVRLLKERAIDPYLKDNRNAWDMSTDGTYVRRSATGKPWRAQDLLIGNPFSKVLLAEDK